MQNHKSPLCFSIPREKRNYTVQRLSYVLIFQGQNDYLNNYLKRIKLLFAIYE